MSPARIGHPYFLRLTKSEQEHLGRVTTKTNCRHWVIAWWRFMFVIEVPEHWCRQDPPTAPAPVYRPCKEDSK